MPSRRHSPCGRFDRTVLWACVARVSWCALLLVTAGSLPTAAIAQQASALEPLAAQPPAIGEQPFSLRLRVYWDSGAAPQAWTGAASLSEGALTEVRPWGSRADTPTLAREADAAVVISALAPRRNGAFDVTATGAAGSTLRIELAADAQQPTVVEVALADLATKPHQVALGEAGGILRIYRADEDLLRVRSERKQFIFSPGESFPFHLQAALPNLPARSPIDLQVELLAGRGGGDAFDSQVQRAAADANGGCDADFELALPPTEGVYTVRLSARRPAGFMRGWGKAGGKPLAERSFELVVWDPSQATQPVDAGHLVVEIDPTNSRWWLRMKEWKWTRHVPWLPKGPLGSEPAELINDAVGRWVRLRPAPTPNTVSWQAYPLPIDHPGAPHILEIETPDDQPQSLNLTLFDRDTIGRAAPLGDSLTAMTGGSRVASASGVKVIRKLFWPKTDSPMLVVSNDGSSQALYGRVRVLSLGRQPLAGDDTPGDGERPVLASLASASLVKAMNATLKPSADGRYVYEDWQTFYDAAIRLADYVQLGGFNGAVVRVASAEGTVYPTAVLGQQSGLDWELVASGMTDVPRKDLLELLLREFDRRGLKLTLAMDLESALPAVERARAAGDAVDAVDAAGRPPVATALQYNPLNPHVRQALVAAVAEVAQKGSSHRSFAGIALNLTTDSNAVLRGDAWCTDAQTVDAFLSASKLQWPVEAPRTAENVQRALAGAWNQAWREWRAASMAALYGQMAHAVVQARPDAKLQLMSDNLLTDAEGRRVLRPRLEGRASLNTLLMQRGIDRERIAAPPNLSLVTPRFADLPADLNDAALPMQLNNLCWSDQPLAADQKAAQLARTQREATLPGFKARSPFGAEQTFTATTLGRVAFGAQSTASLVGLALRSPSGELWEDASPLPLDPPRRAVRGLLRQTPAHGAAKLESRQQPLAVWTLKSAGRTYLLVGNPSDWPLKATLTLDAPKPCSARRLSSDAAANTPLARLEPGKHALPVELPAQELAIYHIDGAEVSVVGVRAEAQADALAVLAEEVDQLGRRDLNARLPFTGCANLSFEEIGVDGLSTGWEQAGVPAAGGVQSSNQSAVDGESCVQITAGAAPVKLVSKPFAAPQTRQLVMTFFVRPERRSDESSLTIRYLIDDVGPERFTTIAGAAFGEEPGWRQFVFSETLPLGAAGPMRVEFEARNLEVSIDKLDLQSLAFPLDYELGDEARRQRLALVHVLQSAKIALADGRVTDCEEILDGYWARFLQEHTPLVQRKPEPAVVAEEGKPKEEAPQTSSRWKSYIPGFLRF